MPDRVSNCCMVRMSDDDVTAERCPECREPCGTCPDDGVQAIGVVRMADGSIVIAEKICGEWTLIEPDFIREYTPETTAEYARRKMLGGGLH